MRNLRAPIFLAVVSSYALNSACCVFALDEVPFGSQFTLVIFDPAKKRQHFVRTAYFDAKTEFSFIVPTPSVPEIKEADPEVFEVLHREFRKLDPFQSKSAGEAAAAEVVQTVDVGSFRAQTLRADDGDALGRYLKSNGYKVPAGGKEWLDHYAKNGWYLTALKIRPGVDQRQATLEAVRFSFATEKPFNPYYVPKGNLGQSGVLTMYTLTKGQVEIDKLGDLSRTPGQQIILTSALRDEIAEKIGLPVSELADMNMIGQFSMPFARKELPDITLSPRSTDQPPILAVAIATGLGLAASAWFLARSRS